MEPKLSGNIIEHMRLINELSAQQFTYFHSYSKLWIHIRASIEEEAALVDHPRYFQIEYRRGLGAAIRIEEIRLLPQNFSVNPPTEGQYFRFKISVTYYEVDEDGAHDYYSSTFTRRYHIDAPIALATHWDLERFKEWVSEVRVEAVEEKKSEAIYKLQQMINAHPKAAKDFVSLLP